MGFSVYCGSLDWLRQVFKRMFCKKSYRNVYIQKKLLFTMHCKIRSYKISTSKSFYVGLAWSRASLVNEPRRILQRVFWLSIHPYIPTSVSLVPAARRPRGVELNHSSSKTNSRIEMTVLAKSVAVTHFVQHKHKCLLNYHSESANCFR